MFTTNRLQSSPLERICDERVRLSKMNFVHRVSWEWTRAYSVMTSFIRTQTSLVRCRRKNEFTLDVMTSDIRT